MQSCGLEASGNKYIFYPRPPQHINPAMAAQTSATFAS